MEATTIVGSVADELKGGAERWAPVIGIKAANVGGIESANLVRLDHPPVATRREAINVAVRALEARPDAIVATAVRVEECQHG